MYNEQWKNNISKSLQNMNEYDKKIRAQKISNKTKGKPKPENFGNKISKSINQYDLEGNFIKEWSSIKEAEIFFYGKTNGSIGACCRGIFKHVKGFKWKFKG